MNIPSLFVLILISFVSCNIPNLNNSHDTNSKSFLETSLLRCWIGEFECLPIIQNNNGIKEWTRFQTGGVTTYSYSKATAVDRFGSIFLAGTTNGSVQGQVKISPSTYNDFFLSKFDSEGNQIWTKQMGSLNVSSTYLESLHLDRFGDLYIGGSSALPLNELSGSGGGFSLIKLNANGNVIWTKVFPTGGETLGYRVTTDNEGSVYITGNTEEQLLFGEAAGGGRNTFVFKYNRVGDLIWTRLFDTPVIASYGNGILFDSFSNLLYVVGDVSDSGTFLGGTLPGGLSNAYIVALQPSNGQVLWSRFLGTAGATVSIKNLVSDSKGFLYLVGDTDMSLDNQPKEGNIVQVLAKFSTTGDKIWTKLFGAGGTTNTRGSGIYADNSNHIYTTGITTGNLGGELRQGIQDFYLSKFDREGNWIWTRLSGGNGGTVLGEGIHSDKYGTLYVSGATDTSFDGQTKIGTNDSFLIKYK